MSNKNGWLIFGFFATFAYGVAAFVFGEVQANFIAKFAALELNAQGDTLAGFFAPLAFLWLFIATMIQSQELAAQRREIESNRVVMQEQSDAARDQASFLKAQTDAMERQTQLLIEQVRLAQQAGERSHKMALFEKRIEIYNGVVDFARLQLVRRQFREEHVTTLQVLSSKAEFVFGGEVIEWLERLYQLVDLIRTETGRYEGLVGYDRYGSLNSGREPELNSKIDKQIEDLNDMLWGGQLREVMGKYLNLNEYIAAHLAVTEEGDSLQSSASLQAPPLPPPLP